MVAKAKQGQGLLIAVSMLLAVALTACEKKSADKPAGDKPAAEKPAENKKAIKAADGEKKADTPKKAEAPKQTGPVAKVNGTVLDRAEFDKKYAKMTKAFTTRKKDIPEGLSKRYKESILKQLVDKELLRQEYAKQTVKIDGEALAKELEDYKKMFRTEENFQRYLKSSDVTLESIKANIEHNLAVTALLEKSGDLAVTDDDVKKYYDENSKRYEVKEQVRASHILFKVNAKEGDKAAAEAKKKADEVYKEAAKKGADFAALAKKHSQGPTAPRGGDLSYFTKGRMVPEFEKVAFAMKVNDLSKPVKTQFGWHIIKVTDKKEGRTRPFDEVKESIGKLLKNKKTRKAKADLLKRLKTGAKIETMVPGVDLNKPTASPAIKLDPGAKKITPKIVPKPNAPKPMKKPTK